MIDPVLREVLVETSQARAFEVFTAGIDRWWPREHHIGKSPLARAVLEPAVKWFADNGTRNLLRAEGQFLLAQAEWATGAKGEARRDAESARAMLPSVSPRGRKLVPEVDRWLAAHAR